MRKTMSGLIGLAMIFTVVSISEAAAPYPCIESPAYTHYTDAKNGACPAPEGRGTIPDQMGSPGV